MVKDMTKKKKFLIIARIVFLFFMAAIIAVVVALSQLDTKSIRENVLGVLQSATDLPIEIEGDVSWKLSLRPRVTMHQVKIPSADWAKNKYMLEADTIDVRLDLLSLFKNRPTIQSIRVYDVKFVLTKNSKGEYSFPKMDTDEDSEESVYTADSGVQMEKVIPEYPFVDPGLGGVQIKNISANIDGEKYNLAGLNIRYLSRNLDAREYRGWLKIDSDVLPFIVSFDKYNPQRKIYPVKIAFSSGGDALVADVALEETSKYPIDFIIKGNIPDVKPINKLFNLNIPTMPDIQVNISGGLDRSKLTLHKSSFAFNNVDISASGTFDWNKKVPEINLNLSSKKINLIEMFPELYTSKGGPKKDELNVFHDMPLFGKYLYGKKLALNVNLGELIVYRRLNFKNMNVKASVNNNLVHVDAKTIFADGDVHAVIDGTVSKSGVFDVEMGGVGEKLIIGNLLKQIITSDIISDLPVDFQMYVQARGSNMSEIMQTITGPVRAYSVGPGYAHSDLVAYVYGTDFLTTLRHSIHDLFSSKKKYNQMTISGVVANLKLRNGLIETKNGVAIETNAINIRLTGNVDLGKESLKLSLTTIPVRGLKLSLSGNIVNTITISGNLAEPDISISGAAIAGKALSATGLGLLLAPLTGGIGLLAGAGVGLLAGDLLENWLADDHPCKTALERGAPSRRDDPEWMDAPVPDLANSVINPTVAAAEQ